MQYIRYGPGVNPTPPPRNGKLLNISKTIEIPTLKPYILLVPCVASNICNTLDMAPGVTPFPRNGILAEYLENY
jgi:hypothetical protein